MRDLSEAEFRAFVEKLVNWPLFSARERVVKVLNTMPPECATDTPLSTLLSPDLVAFIAAEMPLLSAFFAFFVEHLALDCSWKTTTTTRRAGVARRTADRAQSRRKGGRQN